MIETVRADLPGLRQLSAEAAAPLQDQFKAAIQTVQAGDLATAFRLLDGCTSGIAAATRAARTREAGATIPEGTVRQAVAVFEAARAKWASARLRSIDGLDALTGVLRQQDDIDLHDIADRIDRIATEVPDQVDKTLDALIDAAAAGDAEAVAVARKQVAALVDRAADFLSDYEEEIANCEDNPWNVQISIAKPVGEALDAIEAALSSR